MKSRVRRFEDPSFPSLRGAVARAGAAHTHRCVGGQHGTSKARCLESSGPDVHIQAYPTRSDARGKTHFSATHFSTTRGEGNGIADLHDAAFRCGEGQTVELLRHAPDDAGIR